jgi:hypothetical protein
VPSWRNWQTRTVQVRVGITPREGSTPFDGTTLSFLFLRLATNLQADVHRKVGFLCVRQVTCPENVRSLCTTRSPRKDSRAHSFFSEAMSMQKRYFTSDLIIRS